MGKNRFATLVHEYQEMKEEQKYQRCDQGLWDTTVPGITFDETSVSNYSRIFEKLKELYPRGEKGKKDWDRIIKTLKARGKGKRYDCIIGVSGGTDSSYLLHLAREYGLHPLAVTLDNGWSSDISVKNIKKITTSLKIDLETYVVDYEEMKDILISYMKSGLPWIDLPTDLAIRTILYRIAKRENIKYILIGNDFRSEGTQPNEWTHGDLRQLRYIHKKFGKSRLKTFPCIGFFELFYLGYIKGIKMIRPYYYIDYQKKKAQIFLKEFYDWDYYGGHHHENLFTKFAISDWLMNKFKIDKRIITLSAQIMSGEITRENALNQIAKPPYDVESLERDRKYIIKKLDLTEKEFNILWQSPNKSINDYPSYLPFIQRFIKLVWPILKLILFHKPMMLFQIEVRKK